MIARGVLTIAAMLGLAASASGAITVNVDVGTQFNAPSIGEFSVQHLDMHGLKVTAFFSNSTSETEFFDGPSGSAAGSRFLLTEVNDTFFNKWTLTNLDSNFLLTRLLLEGGANGNTVFDVQEDYRTTSGVYTSQVPDPASQGTTGSQRGLVFRSINEHLYGNTTATYRNIVSLGGGPVVGDVWTTLDLQFSAGLPGPIGFDMFPLKFEADTDIIGAAAPVPEPSSLTVMIGLALVGAWRCRRSVRTKSHQS